MSWWQVLGALFQLLLPILKTILEKNQAKKKDQQAAIDGALNAIQTHDASAFTANLAILNRRVR